MRQIDEKEEAPLNKIHRVVSALPLDKTTPSLPLVPHSTSLSDLERERKISNEWMNELTVAST